MGLSRKNQETPDKQIGSGQNRLVIPKFFVRSIIHYENYGQCFCVKSPILWAEQMPFGDPIQSHEAYQRHPNVQLEINPKRGVTHLIQQHFQGSVEFFKDRFHLYFWVNSLIFGDSIVTIEAFELFHGSL